MFTGSPEQVAESPFEGSMRRPSPEPFEGVLEPHEEDQEEGQSGEERKISRRGSRAQVGSGSALSPVFFVFNHPVETLPMRDDERRSGRLHSAGVQLFHGAEGIHQAERLRWPTLAREPDDPKYRYGRPSAR